MSSTTTIDRGPSTSRATEPPTIGVQVPAEHVAAACPVSFDTIDARVARLGATATAVLLVVYVATGAWPVLALVVADYVARVSPRHRAPLGLAAAAVLRRLHVEPRPMDRAPKVFAWQVGFGMAILALVLAPVAATASVVVAAVLAGFSALDGLGNVCVGCLMHRHVVLPLRRRRSAA